MKTKRLIALVLLLVLCISVLALFSACDSGHAPGYGDTTRCTICGKAATHKSTNYGFCDVHWEKATGQ